LIIVVETMGQGVSRSLSPCPMKSNDGTRGQARWDRGCFSD
jgi:hypothetical protein